MGYHIGKLIKTVREQSNISQEELVKGLCGRGILSRIEAGEQEPDKWLADVLLERLGVSPNKFGCIFTKEEWEEQKEKEKLLLLLQEEKRTEILDYYERYRKGQQGRESSPYKEQFLCYVYLVATLEDTEFQVGKKEEVLEVLKLTIPEFQQESMEQHLLGRVEWALLVLLADVLCQAEETREQGISLYHRILLRLPEKMKDQEELKRTYPYVVALFLERLSEFHRESELWICRKGLEVLQKNRQLHALPTLLKYENKYQDLYRVLDSLGKTEKSRIYYFAKLAEGSVRGIAQGENLKRIRKSKGLKQREVAGDICSVRSLSRIESKGASASPHTYRSVLDALGQPEYRYFPHVISDDIQMHESRSQISRLIALRKYEEADFELLRLEQGLDRAEVLNRQIVMRFRAVLKAERGIISREEELTSLYEALAITVPPDVDLVGWPLKQNEVVLLNNIGNTLEAEGKLSDAINVLELVIKSYEEHPKGIGCDAASYLISVYNLTRYLCQTNRFEDALELSEEGLQVALQEDNGYYAMGFLYKKAWNIEKIYQRDGKDKKAREIACLSFYKQAISFAKFFHESVCMKIISDHCQNEYGIVIDEYIVCDN